MGNAGSSSDGHTSPFGGLTDRAKSVRDRGRSYAEKRVLSAFTSLVERQARGGGLDRNVDRALADTLRLVQMTRDGQVARGSLAVREVIDQFHRLFYMDQATWRQNTWQGNTTWKCPL